MIGIVTTLIVTTLLVGGSNAERYQGYKLYQVNAKTAAHAKLLQQFNNDPNFDFFKYSGILGKPSDVMVSPQGQRYFEKFLKNSSGSGLEYKVLVEDVQETLDKKAQELHKPKIDLKDSSDLFKRYLSHDEILDYLKTLEEKYPNIVRLESIGQSYEGRDLLLIHIENEKNPNRPTILLDAGIHAREWITTPTALYLIYQLVENATNVDLIKNVNWAILPSINPDGYEYSRTSQGYMWRKTRKPNVNSNCIGTDANRNFGFHWMEAGASQYPCDEIYAGPESFSEPETTDLQQYILANKEFTKLYINLHSYGEYVLYPWGYTSDLPDNAAELQSLGEEVAKAIEKVSTLDSDYTIGSPPRVLYPASGGSLDWAKGVGGVPLSYAIELPGAGLFGFDPPENLIRPIVEETFEGFRVFQSYVENKFV